MLVSEVMLQQTQAPRVVPFYERFLHRFPDVESLARAPGAAALREWGSLGYNRRALNLWRAARAVVANGGFPSTIEELLGLPGVGPYTARAVASFAFGVDCGVVDANVRRVLSRVCPEVDDLQRLADDIAPRGSSAVWNQAMIDLGATVCTARRPRCDECPLRRMCRSAGGVRPPATTRPGAPPFRTTSRYVRGRIVSELRAGSCSTAVLQRRVGVGRSRFVPALRSLERDGLVHRSGGRVGLGSPT